jgi:uncharacterized protein (DUF697 family)
LARGAKVGPRAVLSLLREARSAAGDSKPLGVAGARELVAMLARELRRGGDPGAVAEQRVDGVAAVVWIGAADEATLREAARSGVPVLAVSEADTLPYVLATDIVRVAAGSSFPLDEIAEAVARGLGERGTTLAARLPVLRAAVCAQLISSFARKNAAIGAAVFIPGVDMPLLTLNQARLVLRIAAAYGVEIDNERVPELLSVVGAGFGFRAVARELLDFVPIAGWAVKGGVAYAGTKAIGEAAVRYFEARTHA